MTNGLKHIGKRVVGGFTKLTGIDIEKYAREDPYYQTYQENQFDHVGQTGFKSGFTEKPPVKIYI